jgi:formate C-acetyltransferase
LVTPFLLAFDEVVALHPASRTMGALWERYLRHLGISVNVMKEGLDWHMAHHAENTAEIVLNPFCHGPIERGLDASNGGVDIYNLTVDGVGLATVADSFAAIEQRVIQEKRLTWEDLAMHLQNDYADAEAVRLMLKNIPRFGSGNSRADAWAKRISQAYVQLYDTPTPQGYNIIPGLFSHGDVVAIGKRIGATPNGRHAGAPISHSSEPDPGFMPGGGGGTPTAKANAVAAVQPGRGNSAPLQLDIDRSLLKGDNGSEQTELVDTVEALIKTHNAQGGTLVNLNIISKAQILEAHADPSKYPDLMVRVTGYSAYFHSLSPEYRQQVVDRILG